VTTVKVQVRPLKEKMFSTVRKYYQDVGSPLRRDESPVPSISRLGDTYT
jgi:hypothetical protein